MAYTPTVTKSTVTKLSDVLYNITVSISISDGVSTVFERTASAKYNTNAGDMESLKAALIADVKNDWDKWKAEDNVFNAAAFDTLVSDMTTTINTYINQ